MRLSEPLPGWLNVTEFGAIAGDGRDDSSAFNAAVERLGVDASTLFIPPGTYEIAAPIRVWAKEGIQLYAPDPTTTRLRWTGAAAGGPIMDVNGTRFSRFGGFSMDGGGQARLLLHVRWGGDLPAAGLGQGFYSTMNLWEDMGFYAAQNGALFGGDYTGPFGGSVAEQSLRRLEFVGFSRAALETNNFNTFNFWIRESRFADNAIAVNELAGPGIQIDRVLFERSSQADFLIGNKGYYSIRNSVSRGSARFVQDLLGETSTILHLHNNHVTGLSGVAVDSDTPVHLTMTDNVFEGANPLQVRAPFWILQGDGRRGTPHIVSVGNRYSSAAPFGTPGAPNFNFVTPQARLLSVDDQLGATAPAAPNLQFRFRVAGPARPIIRVAPAADLSPGLQAAINEGVRRASERPIIHIPRGDHVLLSSVTVPPAAGLTLVGDGFIVQNTATRLVWRGDPSQPMIVIEGPTRILMRDLTMATFNDRSRRDPIIRLRNVDAPGSALIADHTYSVPWAQFLTISGARHLRFASIDSLTAKPDAFRNTEGRPIVLRGGARALIAGGQGDGVRLEGSATAVLLDHHYEGPVEGLFELAGSSALTLYNGRHVGTLNFADDPTGRHLLELDGFGGTATVFGVSTEDTELLRGTANTGALVRWLSSRPIGVPFPDGRSGFSGTLVSAFNQTRCAQTGALRDRPCQVADDLQGRDLQSEMVEALRPLRELNRADWAPSDAPGASAIVLERFHHEGTSGILVE